MREIDAELNDPTKYVRVPGRVIFDEHDEVYWEKDGRPVPEGTAGAKRKVRRFSKDRLEEIASRCNERDATGSLSPIIFGHTDPKQKDETRQPRGRGYAREYAVAYSEPLGRHVITSTFFVKKADYAEAKTYPRVSIELWDRHGVIDPIALLRRTPARDLGQWTYSRDDGPVLRYAMGAEQMDENDDDDLDLPEAPMDEEAPAAEPSHEEQAEAFNRHCYSHPYAAKMAAHYAMPADEGAPMGDDDPTAPPSAMPGQEAPLMNNMATLGGSNGFIPGSKKKPAAPKKEGPSQFARDSERLVASRYEKRIAALEAQLAETRQKESLESGRRYVTQLAAEGYELDADEEALAFSRLDEEGRQKRADHVRRYYRQAPVGYDRPLPLAQTTPTAPKKDKDGKQKAAEEMRDLDEAMYFVRERGMSYDEAVQYARKARSSNGSTNNGNGSSTSGK